LMCSQEPATGPYPEQFVILTFKNGFLKVRLQWEACLMIMNLHAQWSFVFSAMLLRTSYPFSCCFCCLVQSVGNAWRQWIMSDTFMVCYTEWVPQNTGIRQQE